MGCCRFQNRPIGADTEPRDATGYVRTIQTATRDHRLAEFNTGPPPLGQPLQFLCEDHNGTYLLPFRCEWRDGAWYASEKTKPIEATVVGWRPARW
jgi:hypothetical protein